MRLLPSSSRVVFGGMVALVAAVTTALAVLVPTLTHQAGDAGARSVVGARSGLEVGLDLALPASGDPAAQDALVRRAIEQVMPARVGLSIERTETTGLVDVGPGRAYLASIDGPALPLDAGRWPTGAAEAALGSTDAATLGVGVGDTLVVGGRAVQVAGLWSASRAATDRWFGVRAAFATGGGVGPVAVSAEVVDAVATTDALAREVHWTLQPDAAHLDLSSLQDVSAGWRSLPEALSAQGVDAAEIETAGALVPTAQIASARAAVLDAAAPVALATVVLASLAVTALFAALLVGSVAAERRIRWARGQPLTRIVAVEAGRALPAGVVGSLAGAAVVVALTSSFVDVPWIVAAVAAGAVTPAVLVAAFAVRDVRALGRAEGAVSPSWRWGAGVAASVLLLVAGFTTWRALTLGSTVADGRGGLEPDPVAVAAPAALLPAVVLVATAGPLVVTKRLRERRASAGGATRFLFGTGAARRPFALAATIAVVGVVVGQLGFAAMYQSTWDAAYRTALASAEGTAVRIVGDGDDLTPAVLERVSAVDGVAGVAPVWTSNASIAARSTSLVIASPAAVAALADPAIPDRDRLAEGARSDAAGPVLPTGTASLRVEVRATDATASPAAVVLADDWGRVLSVEIGPEGAFAVPPVADGPGGAWRLAAIEVEVETSEEFAASVGIDGVNADGSALELGTAVMPVDISGDAIDMRTTPGPAEVPIGREITRVRFVPVGSAASAVVSRAFAAAAGVDEGDTLPLALAPGAEARPVRVAAVVPLIPGAPRDSAVFVDAAAALSSRLRTATALPGADGAWLSAGSGTDAVAAVLPDGARLAGAAADDGYVVLSTVTTLLWAGAAGLGILALAGLAAIALVTRRARLAEAVSLRAIGVGAAVRRRLRVRESAAGVGAGAVVGVVASAATAAMLLPAVITGALPRTIEVHIVVEPVLLGGVIVAAVVLALGLAVGFAVRGDLVVEGDQR
ncbi:hypothetical protein [Microbacterium testaceum]|uniref:hypothetical protein n=1 Tax=Microbacterium testaceum TaxID=2033 RepID=UPI001245CC24|nr:hypothetical protein [Microbacterium testaceum]